jgi:hypothetical protein
VLPRPVSLRGGYRVGVGFLLLFWGGVDGVAEILDGVPEKYARSLEESFAFAVEKGEVDAVFLDTFVIGPLAGFERVVALGDVVGVLTLGHSFCSACIISLAETLDLSVREMLWGVF